MTTSQTSSTTAIREPLPLGVRLIAGYYVALALLFGALGLVAGASLGGAAGPFSDLASAATVIYGALGLIHLAVGIGLFRRHNWARIVAFVFGLLSFASIVGLLIAYYLAKASTARHFTSN